MTEVAHLTIRLRLFSDRVHNCDHPPPALFANAPLPPVGGACKWNVALRRINGNCVLINESRPE
jgi:hypothetical protein